MNKNLDFLLFDYFSNFFCSKTEHYALNKFKYINSRKHLKKENLRCQIIRSFKRALREIVNKKKLPIISGLHSFDSQTPKAVSLWNEISCIVSQFSEFSDIAQTENGPNTDGKSKKKEKVSAKSYNTEYCKSFFEPQIVRFCFSFYLELIFTPFEPKKLTKKFKFLCCEEKDHRFDCLAKWDLLKRYLNYIFFLELELEPVIQSKIVSLPSISFCIQEFE